MCDGSSRPRARSGPSSPVRYKDVARFVGTMWDAPPPPRASGATFYEGSSRRVRPSLAAAREAVDREQAAADSPASGGTVQLPRVRGNDAASTVEAGPARSARQRVVSLPTLAKPSSGELEDAADDDLTATSQSSKAARVTFEKKGPPVKHSQTEPRLAEDGADDGNAADLGGQGNAAPAVGKTQSLAAAPVMRRVCSTRVMAKAKATQGTTPAPALKQLDAGCRDAIRAQLVQQWGSGAEAARRLNLNGNHLISLQELAQQLEEASAEDRLVREAKVLFAKDPSGLIDVRDLFPEIDFASEPRLMTTRDFWGHWCKAGRARGGLFAERGPRWQATSTEDLFLQFASTTERSEQDALSHRQMRQRIRLLKTDGFSDASVRQVVAKHLPKGTGPRLENSTIRTFSDAEVRDCRISYKNKVNDSVQNIQRSLRGLQEQRRLVSKVKDEFHDKCNRPDFPKGPRTSMGGVGEPAAVRSGSAHSRARG